MQSREEIFATLRDALVELFELDAERVTLEQFTELTQRLSRAEIDE